MIAVLTAIAIVLSISATVASASPKEKDPTTQAENKVVYDKKKKSITLSDRKSTRLNSSH